MLSPASEWPFLRDAVGGATPGQEAMVAASARTIGKLSADRKL